METEIWKLAGVLFLLGLLFPPLLAFAAFVIVVAIIVTIIEAIVRACSKPREPLDIDDHFPKHWH